MTYILYNPLANGGYGEDGVSALMETFEAEKPDAVDITGIDAAAFFAARTAGDKVILCGGDGTLHRLVNELGGRAPAASVFLWRFGTGNDFMRDIAPRGAQSLRLNPYLQGLPAADVDGRRIYYLNGCSVGVDALVCRLLNERHDESRRAGYASLAVNAILRQYKPMSGRVTVDGETVAYEKIWLAAAMNGRYQGGGMKFAPGQDRTGDRLCCLVWHDTTPPGTLLRFPFVIPGRHAMFRKYCDFRHGREIAVELDAPADIQLDGETYSGVTGYTARKGSADPTR